MNIKKYLPNILTTLRLLSVPIFILLFLLKIYVGAITIFICASITDFIDGFLARRWKVISKYGSIVDPIADKSLMISALILITIFFNKYAVIPIILEFTIANLNYIIHIKDGIKFYVAYIGKCKTALLMITISYILLNNIIYINKLIEYILIILTIIFQLLTLFKYYKYKKKNKK